MRYSICASSGDLTLSFFLIPGFELPGSFFDVLAVRTVPVVADPILEPVGAAWEGGPEAGAAVAPWSQVGAEGGAAVGPWLQVVELVDVLEMVDT